MSDGALWLAGWVQSVRLETSVVDAGSALFVRHDRQSVADHDDAAADSARSWRLSFVPLQRAPALRAVRASLGTFTARAAVPAAAVRKAVGVMSERHSAGVVLSQVELSAHVVAQAVIADRPLVQVTTASDDIACIG